jgi:hypothetical protein
MIVKSSRHDGVDMWVFSTRHEKHIDFVEYIFWRRVTLNTENEVGR